MIDRSGKRRKVLWPAELHRECRVPIKCHVLDISVGGAKVRTEAFLPIGTVVDLAIERTGVFPAKVVWRRDRHAGLDFQEERWVVQKRLADAPLASVVTTDELDPADREKKIAPLARHEQGEVGGTMSLRVTSGRPDPLDG